MLFCHETLVRKPWQLHNACTSLFMVGLGGGGWHSYDVLAMFTT